MSAKKILIVEDDGILAAHMEDVLADLKYSPCGPVATGEGALRATVSEQPDLVLMDIELAGRLDGIETAERIHEFCSVPIIFLTGYSLGPLPQTAKLTGPYGYLVKPVPDQELAATIEIALYKHELDAKLVASRRELENSRNELKAVYENAPVMMCLLDQDRRLVYANRAFEEFVAGEGGSLTEGAAGGVLGCINALQDPRGCGYGAECATCGLRLALADTLETGRTHRDVERRMTLQRDGVQRQVTLAGATSQVPTHGAPRLLLCLADVTQRERDEEALRENELRYQALIRTAMDGYCVLERSGRFLEVSDAYCNMLGYAREHLLSMKAEDLEAVERPEVIRQRVERVVASGWERFETQHRHADGRPVDVEISVVHLRSRDVLLVFVRDITLQKQAAAQLLQAQKMESVGRLAGGVAHDFNNLLTVINGYSQILMSRLDPSDPIRSQLRQIREAGEKAASLTRQLLAFSRKQVMQPRVFELDLVVAAMAPMLRRLLGEDMDLQLETNAAGDKVHADPNQIEQVIMNLVVNAKDAMASGGELIIRTARVSRRSGCLPSEPEAHPGAYVRLQVLDSGTGMDEETRKHVFEPFFTTKEVGRGTGLGLSTVQGIVAQSGGYVEVSSQLGHGSNFSVYLPLAEAVAEPGVGDGQGQPGAGSETVLVVEDQKEVRAYTCDALRAYGYQVISAGGAQEALEICRYEQMKIDLLITDVVMPGASGRELANQVAELRAGMRILYMSGYTNDVILSHGAGEAGMNLIEKPFSPDQLAAKVREVLGPSAPSG